MKQMRGLLAVVMVATVTGAAWAQLGKLDATPYNFSFRVGIVWPGTDPLQAMENNWLSLGMDYTFTKQFIKDSETYLSVDWIGKSGSGAKGSYWPILFNQKFYTQTGKDDTRSYLTLGLGVVVFDVTSSDTVFGGKLGAGLELSRQIFVEGNYFLSDVAKGGLRANGFGAYLGYRF